MRLIDLTGQRFGRLVVLSRAENVGNEVMWNCICDCGAEKVVSSRLLKTGKTQSCGCYKRDNARKLYSTSCIKNKRLYRVFSMMKDRCYNPNNHAYCNYGARSITICPEWLNDYESFYSWAMNNGYKDGLQIDREDNDKGYSPDNCRWVDRYVQANNKRNIKKYTYNGKTQSLAEWCRDYNVDYYMVRQRIYKLGWSFEQALLIAPCK